MAKAIVATAQAKQITFLAASVAYYAFVSLLPALLLLLVLATTVGGEAFGDRIVALTSDFLTPAGQEAITGAVDDAPGTGGATIIGVGVLAWSTLKVFRALDTAFLTVYGQVETADFIGQLKDATLVLIGIGGGLGVMVAVGAVLAALPLGPAGWLVGIVGLPAVLTLAFVPMYHRFPNPPVPIRQALPGAVFAGIGWTILQAGFQIYAAGAGQYQAYGVAGGILLLVTWLYFAAIIVILGAIINAVRSDRAPSAAELEAEQTDFLPSATDDWASKVHTKNVTSDRQLQQSGHQISPHMSRERTAQESTAGAVDGEPTGAEGASEQRHNRVSPDGAPDISEVDARITELRAEFDSFESDIQQRTVDKPAVESELKGYVRSKMRRGHARGWGPYLVLLYGTAMTLGAFYLFESDWLAILAMLIIFLSTLGLYTLFVMVGVGLNLVDVPGKALDFARNRRN